MGKAFKKQANEQVLLLIIITWKNKQSNKQATR